MPALSLTSTPFDLTAGTGTRLEFRRWLGIEDSFFDHAAVEISIDGTNWSTVWNHSGGEIGESAWSPVSYDVSSVADGQPAVWFRWVMGTTDQSQTHPGWNIDDIRILRAGPSSGCETAPAEPFDLAVWDDRATLDWSPPADLGGAVAPVYDVVRSESPADFTSSVICVEADDGANSWAMDPELPPAGGVYFYLVRAENPCGKGSWGQDSDGFEPGDFVYLGETEWPYSRSTSGKPCWPVDDVFYKGYGKILRADPATNTITMKPYRAHIPHLPEGTLVIRSDHANAQAFEFLDAEYNQWPMEGESVANAGPFHMQHGSWRVEVEPVKPRKADVFLHVMVPCELETLAAGQASLKENVHLFNKDDAVILDITGRTRRFRLTFESDSSAARLVVEELSSGRTILDNALTR